MRKSPRLDVDEFRDLVTLMYCTRGTCDRLRAAATLWDKENRLISGGYNGAISGEPHCDDPGVGHMMRDGHCLRTNHDVDNALLNCSDLRRVEGGTAVVLGSPCFPCARKLIGKGIARIRFIGTYENSVGKEDVKDLCMRKNVELEYVHIQSILLTLEKALNFLCGSGGPFKPFKE